MIFLQSVVSKGGNSVRYSLGIRAGISSGPAALYGLVLSNSCLTPSSEIPTLGIGGNGVPDGVGMSFRSSVENTGYLHAKMSDQTSKLCIRFRFSASFKVRTLARSVVDKTDRVKGESIGHS